MKRRGFMCKVDFDHELGEALGGNRVFPSVKDCKLNRQCTTECGIVEVEVRLVSVTEQEGPIAFEGGNAATVKSHPRGDKA